MKDFFDGKLKNVKLGSKRKTDKNKLGENSKGEIVLSTEQVNLAIVGCGGIANAHYNGFKALYEKGYKDFVITACCDTVVSKAEVMAEKIAEWQGNTPKVYSDHKVMLKKQQSIDGLCNYTPHDVHHTIVLDAIKAGKQVSTEKPLALTLRAGKIMIDAAEAQGVILHVAENYRLAPKERAINWAINSGKIGEPRILNWLDIGERKWYWDWRDHKEIASGGWTIDGGVHFSDLWQHHIGEIDKVYSVSRSFDPVKYIEYDTMDDFEKSRQGDLPRYRKTRSLKDINPETLKEPIESNLEDTTSAILEFSNGCVGTWVVSRSAPGRTDRSNILYGSEGALSWNEGIFNQKQELVYTIDELVEAYMTDLSVDDKEKLFPFGLTAPMAIEDKQFVDAIKGKGAVEVDAWTGYKAMAIPMAVYESAAIGAPVSVQDVLDLKVETYQAELNKIIGI